VPLSRVVTRVFRAAQDRRRKQQGLSRFDRKAQARQKQHVTRLQRWFGGRKDFFRRLFRPACAAYSLNFRHEYISIPQRDIK
jgi:hypothetical protein